ncbi:MAG: dTDP-4-dehydrorhamnose reductase [Bacteroidales bacterium]|jgi:dTDP-4-dehydrorhamnose reductase|nr:dTDP-4-dehydrorhamnose reductase [Bacteroidales bacterium]
MKYILVTGANGQLGKKIRDLTIDNKELKFIFCDIEEFDITKVEEVNKFFEGTSIDLVINCAAFTAVDLAESEQEAAYSVNSYAPGLLAKATNIQKAKIIHISTDYVFDGTKNTPYSEKDKTNPTSVYGKTKLEGEQNTIKENPDAIIIRTSWLYSEYGKNFTKTIIELGKKKDFLKVVYDQVGTPTYAGDLAEAVLSIVYKYFNENFWIPGIYHFSNQGVCSWYDFAVKILNSCNINIDIFPVLSNEFPTVAIRPKYSVLNKEKIIKNYGINIPHWVKSCEKMLLTYKDFA